GSQNLDGPEYRTGNGGHWPFLPANDSGAIMVGAGFPTSLYDGTDISRARLGFSNYGSRLNLQGWGTGVITTGYGDLYSSEGANLWYTFVFSGTSSASPIVASAVALVESIHEEINGAVVTPALMRSILVNTGSPQQSGSRCRHWPWPLRQWSPG
ncbi:MAG: S8 family serine peptidase, partial [Chloroflexi bacterium]|nr:S8 family serine peptidase [Chloroflexota bacterium]